MTAGPGRCVTCQLVEIQTHSSTVLGPPDFFIENIPSGNWVAQGAQQVAAEGEREIWSTLLSQQCDANEGPIGPHLGGSVSLG